MNAERILMRLTVFVSVMVTKARPAARVTAKIADLMGNVKEMAHKVTFNHRFGNPVPVRIRCSTRQAFACLILLDCHVLARNRIKALKLLALSR